LTHALGESEEMQKALQNFEAKTPTKPKESGLGQRTKKRLGTD